MFPSRYALGWAGGSSSSKGRGTNVDSHSPHLSLPPPPRATSPLWSCPGSSFLCHLEKSAFTTQPLAPTNSLFGFQRTKPTKLIGRRERLIHVFFLLWICHILQSETCPLPCHLALIFPNFFGSLISNIHHLNANAHHLISNTTTIFLTPVSLPVVQGALTRGDAHRAAPAAPGTSGDPRPQPSPQLEFLGRVHLQGAEA